MAGGKPSPAGLFFECTPPPSPGEDSPNPSQPPRRTVRLRRRTAGPPPIPVPKHQSSLRLHWCFENHLLHKRTGLEGLRPPVRVSPIFTALQTGRFPSRSGLTPVAHAPTASRLPCTAVKIDSGIALGEMGPRPPGPPPRPSKTIFLECRGEGFQGDAHLKALSSPRRENALFGMQPERSGNESEGYPLMAAGGHSAFAPRPCRAQIAVILKPYDPKGETRRKASTTTNKNQLRIPIPPWKAKKNQQTRNPVRNPSLHLRIPEIHSSAHLYCQRQVN